MSDDVERVNLSSAGREPFEHLACCGDHWTQQPGGHCDWTCCEHDEETA